MSLLDQAKADLQAILTDNVGGFAVPITVTNPGGFSAIVNGQQTSIGIVIDPQTGMPVAGRKVSVALSIAALTAAGLAEPKGVSSGAGKPWLVSFALPTGATQTFKVSESLPDELGCVVLILEFWK